LCEQGKSSDAEQILDQLQQQQLIQIQDVVASGPGGYGQQQIMEDSSNEIMATASPMSQQIE